MPRKPDGDGSGFCLPAIHEKMVVPIGLGVLVTLIVAIFAFGGAWGAMSDHCKKPSGHESLSELKDAMAGDFVSTQHFNDEHRLLRQEIQFMRQDLDRIATAVGAPPPREGRDRSR